VPQTLVFSLQSIDLLLVRCRRLRGSAHRLRLQRLQRRLQRLLTQHVQALRRDPQLLGRCAHAEPAGHRV
jgi:hypothetical protein